MMRKLRFRAWDKTKKGWIQGFAIGQDGGIIAEIRSLARTLKGVANGLTIHQIEQMGTSIILNQSVIIMQSTNLLDKSGKEIFEGDIVQWQGFEVLRGKQIRPIRKFVVEWNFLQLLRLENITRDNGTAEVIGNIYENPDYENNRKEKYNGRN